MIERRKTYRHFMRSPRVSAAVYLALVVALCLTSVFLLMDILQGLGERNASLELLGRLKERALISSSEPGGVADLWPPGSPILEGQTATTASAALLQRIAGAITRVGGSVVSTEVEAQGSQSKDDYLRVHATCEIEQSVLQQLLYDIEAGMPFLFVDQLVVQAPPIPSEGGRMRVLIGVSGLWGGTKQ
jgi:general secretion pathway protein M